MLPSYMPAARPVRRENRGLASQNKVFRQAFSRQPVQRTFSACTWLAGLGVGGLGVVVRVRFILALLTFGIGLLWCLWDHKYRALYDVLARTQIIRVDKGYVPPAK